MAYYQETHGIVYFNINDVNIEYLLMMMYVGFLHWEISIFHFGTVEISCFSYNFYLIVLTKLSHIIKHDGFLKTFKPNFRRTEKLKV